MCIDPDERPTAEDLLSHPFITKYSPEETLSEVRLSLYSLLNARFLTKSGIYFLQWTTFIEEQSLCEERTAEVDSLAEAVYRHIYERCVKFSFQPQVSIDCLLLLYPED